MRRLWKKPDSMLPKWLDNEEEEEDEVAGRQKELLRSRNSGRKVTNIFNFCK